MRRSSVIGPLLLILIGAGFLIHNVWPQIAIFDLVAQYWPFLLIVWGSLRVLEILVWAAARKPLPRSGLSGAEWLAVIGISLFGTGLYTVRHYSPTWMPMTRGIRGLVFNLGESFDFSIKPVARTLEVPTRIVIESFRGNARITGGDGDQVKVSGRKTIRAFQQTEADAGNTNTPVELVQQGNELIVRTNQDRVNSDMRVTEDLEIVAPRGSSVEAHGRYGDFEIHDIAGTVDINSDNAGVRLDGIGGDVRIELRKSDIVRATGLKGKFDLKGHGEDVELQNVDGQVTVNGDFLGQVQMRNLAQPVRWEATHTTLAFEHLPGQLHMGPGEFVAANIAGPIRLTGRAIDVQITDFTQSLEMNLERGDVELRPMKTPLAKMDVQVKSGDLDLVIPAGAKFDLKATTLRGGMSNEFGSPLEERDEKHGGTIEGAVGDGPQLRLSTRRGTLTVRKGGLETDADLKVEHQ